MSYTAKGQIYKIGEVKEYGNFRQIEFVLSIPFEHNGQTKYNYVTFKSGGNTIDYVQKFKQGDMVEVSFGLNGNKYMSRRTNQEEFINTLNCYNIKRA